MILLRRRSESNRRIKVCSLQRVEDSTLTQVAIAFGLYDSVTLAGDCLQARLVENLNAPAAVVNQPVFLKNAGGFIDPLAPHAEHVGDEILRQTKLIHPQTVAGHQEPAGEARVHLVEAVADSRLGDLR